MIGAEVGIASRWSVVAPYAEADICLNRRTDVPSVRRLQPICRTVGSSAWLQLRILQTSVSACQQISQSRVLRT